MATMLESATMQAIRERTEPAIEALEKNVRDARKAIVAGRRAVEDYTAGASLQVRRHPLGSVAVAAGAGVLLGCIIGFTLGRKR